MLPDSTDSPGPDHDRRRALELTGLVAAGSVALLAGCGDTDEQEPDDDPAEPEGDDPEDDPTDTETAQDDENSNGIDVDEENSENGQ
jgi:hypothetical protein